VSALRRTAECSLPHGMCSMQLDGMGGGQRGRTVRKGHRYHCTDGLVIANLGTCIINVQFTPTAAGYVKGSVSVSDSDVTGPANRRSQWNRYWSQVHSDLSQLRYSGQRNSKLSHTRNHHQCGDEDHHDHQRYPDWNQQRGLLHRCGQSPMQSDSRGKNLQLQRLLHSHHRGVGESHVQGVRQQPG